MSKWLLAVSNPRYGLVANFVLLCCSLALAFSPFEFADGVRCETPATVFFWLPDSLLGSPAFFVAVRILLVGFTLLWMFHKFTPFSCWATVFFFTLMWSLRMENVTNGAHIFNVTNWLLIVHAAWFQFYGQEITRGKNENSLAIPCYPRWVFILCLFYIGWFHTLAGATKIWESGFDWPTGVSLQLWVNEFGWAGSPFSKVDPMGFAANGVSAGKRIDY